MEAYYILIVAVLFLLAISDLIVGVSNDAVNFLNSAIGSKAAPFKIILAIAAAGVLVGAVFSNGMMEVARKGIFNPAVFRLQGDHDHFPGSDAYRYPAAGFLQYHWPAHIHHRIHCF